MHGVMKKTLSTRLGLREYKEFVERAEKLGLRPSTLLRRIVLEFLDKPLEEYDRVSKLEREIERLRTELLEVRARVDMLTKRIMFLERRGRS